jgi:8-oxo-dGTP pyrophosphatase MutT (NUDIX family)
MAKPKPPKGSKTSRHAQQYAVIPVRLGPNGGLEVLLLTSRGTRRWVIPKGWPMRKRAPKAAAAREAFEEAGVEGVVWPRESIGNYHYAKAVETGALPIKVKVFLLRVERQLETWPEQDERETRWFSPQDWLRSRNWPHFC